MDNTSDNQQRPFLVQAWTANGKKLLQAPALRVSFKEKRKVKSTHNIGGLAFNEVENAGWDRSKLSVRAEAVWDGEGLTRALKLGVLNALGHSSQQGGNTVASSAAGVKTVVRKLRPQEAAKLDAIDTAIGRLEEEIKAFRRQRKEVVAEAWAKGHTVRLADVTPVDGKHWKEVR